MYKDDDIKIKMMMKNLSDKKYRTAMDNYSNYIKSDTPEKRKKFREIWVDFVKNNIDN